MIDVSLPGYHSPGPTFIRDAVLVYQSRLADFAAGFGKNQHSLVSVEVILRLFGKQPPNTCLRQFQNVLGPLGAIHGVRNDVTVRWVTQDFFTKLITAMKSQQFLMAPKEEGAKLPFVDEYREHPPIKDEEPKYVFKIPRPLPDLSTRTDFPTAYPCCSICSGRYPEQ